MACLDRWEVQTIPPVEVKFDSNNNIIIIVTKNSRSSCGTFTFDLPNLLSCRTDIHVLKFSQLIAVPVSSFISRRTLACVHVFLHRAQCHL